jgi:hypothetical protein
MKNTNNPVNCPLIEAQTIINQFGLGFVALTAARQFVWDPKTRILTFRIGNNPKRINTIRIQIVNDLYNVQFARNTPKGGYKVIDTLDGVYCDMLADVFESRTGMCANFLKRDDSCLYLQSDTRPKSWGV